MCVQTQKLNILKKGGGGATCWSNYFLNLNCLPACRPIPVAALFKAWVCGRSLAGIAGSIPAGGMDVCLL
jgi:hypothetical protein